MSSPERLYRGSVRALSVVFVALGLTILVLTFAGGGGPLAMGTLLGAIFVAVGVARFWLSREGRRGRGLP
jgi:hypothetical protein